MSRIQPILTRGGASAVAAAAVGEALLVRLGRTNGSTPQERGSRLPGDDIVPRPDVVTDHAITIDAPTEFVWPWLVQMGWHRGGWYTARWVDRFLFPANEPSATRIVAELQNLDVGDFVPDVGPESGCGFVVERMEPERTLVLHSTSHSPPAGGNRTGRRWTGPGPSFSARWSAVGGRASTSGHAGARRPGWFTLAGRLVVIPADFVMSRDMLHGVKQRAETLAAATALGPRTAVTTRSPAR